MSKALTAEQNQELVDTILQPIINIIDANRHSFSVDQMRATLKNMQNHAGTARAFPLPESQDRADDLEAMNQVFEKAVDLFEARTLQHEGAQERVAKKAASRDILSELGLI